MNKKKTKEKATDLFQKYTTLFGYSLFAVFFLATLFDTGSFLVQFMAHNPAPPHDRLVRVVIAFTLITLASILPPTLSYFSGDAATGKKLPALGHHFNGMVFALTAFVLSMFIVTVPSRWITVPHIPYIPVQITQFWPAFMTIFILVIMGIGYKISKKKLSVLSYFPFSILVITTALCWLLTLGYGAVKESITNHNPLFFGNSPLLSVIGTAATLATFLIAYFLPYAKKMSAFQKLAFASVVLLMATLSISAAGQIMWHWYDANSSVPGLLTYAIGIGIWALYIRSFQMRRT